MYNFNIAILVCNCMLPLPRSEHNILAVAETCSCNP